MSATVVAVVERARKHTWFRSNAKAAIAIWPSCPAPDAQRSPSTYVSTRKITVARP